MRSFTLEMEVSALRAGHWRHGQRALGLRCVRSSRRV